MQLTFELAMVRLGLLQETGADDEAIREATADVFRVAPGWFVEAAIQVAAARTGLTPDGVAAWLEAGQEPGGAAVH